MFECNIDAKGKAARFLGGTAAILGSLILAALLAADASAGITGQVISVDGGYKV